MYRDHTVAAVVPAYNEEGFVGEVIDDLPEFLDRAYVVDDGSTDGTWAEIRRHATERNAAHDGRFDDLVVPIRHEQNRGVGGAIKTGYLRAREAELDLTVVLGGDGQMDPSELTRYLDPIVDGVADYTKGNRFSRPEDYAEMPRFRLLGNVVLSYLTKVASGYWATMDSQNGYTAISLSALEETDIEGMYEYYGYCNDLLVRLNAADIRVGDVPRSSDYAYSEGWKSHINYTEYIPRVSAMLARGFFWRLRRKYLLRRFEPLVPLYLLGIGTVGAGIAGLVSALTRRDGDGGSWFLATVGGALLVLYAAMLDRRDNEHLEVQIEPDEQAREQAVESASERDADSGAVEPDDGSEERTPRSTAQADGGTDDERTPDTESDTEGDRR
ncbi:MAG: glycosyltransferase family 2 protein [Halobacteriota archaeon]